LQTRVLDQVGRSSNGALVSIALPVRNGADTIQGVVECVLAQDYQNLELVISDNASTDHTEEVCRELAARDRRIVYHRHSENIGLLANFIYAMNAARGTFIRWIGDDDSIAPTYVSKCIALFESDPRLILVTTQLNYVTPEGRKFTYPHSDTTLLSDDPVERFEAFSSWLASGSVAIDPLYGVIRRSAVLGVERPITIREDQIFAAKLAFAGPWGHVPEVLGERPINTKTQYASVAVRYLGAPRWHAYVPTFVQSREMARFVKSLDLAPEQRRRAHRAVRRLFWRQHFATLVRRTRRLLGFAGTLFSRRR
jgi:glycosyltransferase involved in cell wall biosynthesis